MSDQPALFPVDQTTDTACPVCHATRPAGQARTDDCEFEKYRDGRSTTRPKKCLNQHRPEHAPIPF